MMMLGTRISRDKKPTLQLLTRRKFVPVAFMCEPYRLISRLANEQNAGRAPVRRDEGTFRRQGSMAAERPVSGNPTRARSHPRERILRILGGSRCIQSLRGTRQSGASTMAARNCWAEWRSI